MFENPSWFPCSRCLQGVGVWVCRYWALSSQLSFAFFWFSSTRHLLVARLESTSIHPSPKCSSITGIMSSDWKYNDHKKHTLWHRMWFGWKVCWCFWCETPQWVHTCHMSGEIEFFELHIDRGFRHSRATTPHMGNGWEIPQPWTCVQPIFGTIFFFFARLGCQFSAASWLPRLLAASGTPNQWTAWWIYPPPRMQSSPPGCLYF